MEQTKVILYSRIGKETKVTATPETSLEEQKNIMSKYCKERQLNPIAHFSDTAAPDSFDRRDFKEMLAFIGNNEQGISYILVSSWDRFTRNPTEGLGMLYQLRMLGVEVEAVDQAPLKDLFSYVQSCFKIHKDNMPEFVAVIGKTALTYRLDSNGDDYILFKVTYNKRNEAESNIIKQLTAIEEKQGKVHGIVDSSAVTH